MAASAIGTADVGQPPEKRTIDFDYESVTEPYPYVTGYHRVLTIARERYGCRQGGAGAS